MYRPTTTFLDDFDLAQLGFVLSPRPPIRDVVEHEYGMLVLPGRDGVEFGDDTPKVAHRTFLLAGLLTADTPAELLTNYRELQHRCGRQDRRLRLVDDSSREIVARLKRITWAYLGQSLPSDVARIEMEWIARDPAWRGTTDTTVNLSAIAAACALGTLRSWPVVTIDGPANYAGEAVEYLDHNNTVLATLGLTVNIGGGQSIAIDMDARTITHPVSGVVDVTLRTSGTYFALDPEDGDPLAGLWPKVRLPLGTGTAEYRKRYAA